MKGVEVPRGRRLQASLREITERLARELAAPAAYEPDWSALQWRLACAVASLHGVSALLADRLIWQGPPDWRAFLESQRRHVAARHARIEALLSTLDQRFRECGIAAIALKGAALHALGIYRPGERPMADIDLLARPADVAGACEVLESLGLHESHSNFKHKVFVPAQCEVGAELGEHAGNYLKVELHERIVEILPLRRVDISERVFLKAGQPGLNAYSSLAALMAHLAIHAAGAMAYRCIRLLHLHDIASVSARMTATDWDELIEEHRGDSARWALPPLQLTARYFPGTIPPEVPATLRRRCRWNVRWISQRGRLSDVSLSYPWIEAFPGIGWSGSLGEMLEYVDRRIRPDKHTLHLRKVLAETQVADAHAEWARLSQGRRMIRWLFAKQTRMETLHAVRMALDERH